MILPQTNARLTAIKRGGTSEDYDAAGGNDTSVWTGDVDAYYGKRRATFSEASVLNKATIQYVIVPGDLGIDFAIGDTLTLGRGSSTWTVEVREFNDRELPLAGAQPIRLDLV